MGVNLQNIPAVDIQKYITKRNDILGDVMRHVLGNGSICIPRKALFMLTLSCWFL